ILSITDIASHEKIKRPIDPTKLGYTFGGWYIDSLTTSPYDFETGVTGNITLYAKWIPNTYIVTFNSNGGSSVSQQNIKHGFKAETPQVPTKDGYQFVCWRLEGSDDTFDFNTAITSNITLVAVWAEIAREKRVVTLEANGGVIEFSSISVDYDTKISLDSMPSIEKEGYKFEGWYSNQELSTKFDFNTSIKTNITLYAKWTINTYAITFNSNEGTAVDPQTVNYNGFVTYPSNPTREGYQFQGWYSDTKMLVEYDFATPVTTSFTLYAKWTLVAHDKYSVSFESNGGTDVITQTNIEHGGYATLPTAPTKTGYTFGGWYKDSLLETPYDFATPVTTSFTLYAKWTLVAHDKYSVSFESNGGTDVITQTNIEHGGYATLPTAPTKTGYTFGGWYKDSLLETPYDFATPVTSSFTLYAKWNVSKFNVTFKTYAGEVLYETTVEYNQDATYVGDTPSKTGFTFDGWDKALTGIKETTIIYAKFSHPILNFSDNEQTKISGVKDKSITSVTIPNGIVEIGNGAFSECEELESIVIPNTVKVIGEEAFLDCYKLSSITLPNELEKISDYAFSRCSALTAIDIPSSVGSIGEGAFSGCEKLSSITLPEGLTEIAAYLFESCVSLSQFNVPSGVTRLGYSAFSNTSIETFTIPNSVTVIDESVFYGCKALKSVSISTNIEEIPNSAFYGCSSLNNVTIPNSVTTIAGSAFYQCSSLVNIHLSDNLTSVGSQAFYMCPIKSIVLPSSLEEIESMAFFANYSLLEVYNLSSLALTMNTTDNGYVAKYAKVIHTSLDDESIYKTIDGFNFAHFDDKYYLTGALNITPIMTFPSSFLWDDVEITEYEIYKSAFENNTTIKEIVFNTGLKAIGQTAFNGCLNLRRVTLPSGLTTIGNQAFSSCPDLLEIYNLSSLSLVKGSINNGYIAKNAIVIHSSSDAQSVIVKDSQGYVFAHYNDMNYLICYEGDEVELTLPSSFMYNENTIDSYAINSYAFYDSNIKKITIPSNVTKILPGAFRLCRKLKDIVIAPGVTEIGSYAFYSCGFESIEIPNTVTQLDEIFPCCYSLKSVVLPNTITAINENAFRACDSLSKVYFKGTKAEWDAIVITESGNSTLISEATTKYFYSETAPTDEGNYWHYVDGVITIWE
ncbi:MAG: leucine-rich repeat protein, partial [Acholeplasmatales bacterium]|nr:leucine-rich repeat protein [Acholeplasmatales bacterium]